METVDIVALRHEQTKETLGLNWFNIYYRMSTLFSLTIPQYIRLQP